MGHYKEDNILIKNHEEVCGGHLSKLTHNKNVSKNQKDWHKKLPNALRDIKITPKESIG